MKKLFLIILLFTQFCLADSIIKIYNKNTGQVVKTYTNNDCKNNSLFIAAITKNVSKSSGLNDLEGMKIYGLITHKEFIEIGCNEFEKDEGCLIGIYDTELFSYSVEKVNYSIKND